MPGIRPTSLRSAFRLRAKGLKVVGFACIFSLLPLVSALSAGQEPALPFRVGERLIFQIFWFGVPTGESEMVVTERTTYIGTPVLRFTSTARSNKTFSLFYPVDDRFESLWDPVERHPLFYRLRQREGSYRSRKRIVLDQENNFAFYQRNNDPAWGYVIRYGTQDALSSLYHLRSMNRASVQPGDRVLVSAFASGKNWMTEVRIEAREVIQTRWGKIPTLRIRPKIKYIDGPLRAKGKVRFWATDDRYRIPVRMQSVVMIIGRVRAELIRAAGIAEDSLLAQAIRKAHARKAPHERTARR